MHIRPSLRLRLFGSVLMLAVPASYGLVAGLSRQEGARGAYVAIFAAGVPGAILLICQTYALLTRAIESIGAALKMLGEGQPARISENDLPSELHALAQASNAASGMLMARQAELHDQLRRTGLLTRLAIDLRASLDPAAIVRDILTAISLQSDAGAAEIVLIGSDGAIELALSSAGGPPRPMPLEQARRALERGPAGWIWRHGGGVVLTNDAQETYWDGCDDSRPTGSMMALPLAHGRATFGVLTISHPMPDHFTSQDLLLFEGVAAQASVALSAAYLRIEERRRRDQALLMLSIGQSLAPEGPAEQLASDLLERSAVAFEAGAAALFLARPDTAGLSCCATYAGSLAECGEHAEMLSAQMAAAAERAWRTGVPTSELLPNMAESAADQLHTCDGWACVALPLRRGGDTIGVFVLARRTRGTAVFSADTWAMLTVFANTVAGACGAAQPIEQLHGHAETLEQPMCEQAIRLQHTRDPMRVIFDHLPDGLVLMEAEGRILIANDALCEDVLGILPRAAVGQNYAAIIQDLERGVQIAIEPHPAAPAVRRARCAAAGGRPRWYEIDRYIVESGAGPEQVIERWRDITRQEEQHRELLHDEQLTTMARLAASVVHEIGNPLQSVRSCIDLSREDPALAAPTAEYLELAGSELKRMSQILGRLRDLYRLPLSEANDE